MFRMSLINMNFVFLFIGIYRRIMQQNLLNISFEFDYLPLLFVIATAWIIPVLSGFLRIQKLPTVILEIIAGYFIGNFLLHHFEQTSIDFLEFLALTGFIFLMFMSGLEIDIDQIIASFPKKKITYVSFLKNPLLVGMAFFMITLIISYSGSRLVGLLIEIKNYWYFSLIMITTSVGIIVPVLKNRAELKSRFGQMMVLAAAVADIMSIILFTLTIVIYKSGISTELFLILVLVIVFWLLYKLVQYFNQIGPIRQLLYQLSHAASQIQIRGSILLLLIFVALSQYLGKEVVLLGAFLGGLLLSIFLHKDRSLLILKLDGMGYGFFIPIFFIMVGVKFDPHALLEFDHKFIWFFLLLLFILYAAKIIPAFLWFRLFGMRKAIAGGFLMSSRLSLIIAASKIGLDLNLINAGMNSCFILLAVITCIVSPLLYNVFNPKDVFRGENTIIVGGSSTNVLLARRLVMHSKPCILVEKKYQRYHDIQLKGLNVVHMDGCNRDTFVKIKLSPANFVVIDTGSDDINLEVCRTLKDNFNHEQIITHSRSSSVRQKLNNMEVEVVDTVRTLATTIENLILRPTTYHALVETFDNYYVEEILITNQLIHGQQVKEIPFHKNGSLMLIKRGSNLYVPHGDTYLMQGDLVVVFGSQGALDDFRDKFMP